MNICELHRLFPPDRPTHISVYERLDPQTLEHVQADEGRCDWLQALIAHPRKTRRCSKHRQQTPPPVLVGGRATPGQKVTREGGGVGLDRG